MHKKMTFLVLFAAALCVGCQDMASSETQVQNAGTETVAVGSAEPAVSAAATADTAPKAAAKPPVAGNNKIVSKAPSQGRADSGCAFVILYAGTQEQPLIRERDGDCNGLDAQFLAVSKLEEIGQLADLSPVDAANIRRSPGGTVFYIEDGATSSAYPLGDENIAYEVVLAD
jgi:hypothetical protein